MHDKVNLNILYWKEENKTVVIGCILEDTLEDDRRDDKITYNKVTNENEKWQTTGKVPLFRGKGRNLWLWFLKIFWHY